MLITDIWSEKHWIFKKSTEFFSWKCKAFAANPAKYIFLYFQRGRAFLQRGEAAVMEEATVSVQDTAYN